MSFMFKLGMHNIMTNLFETETTGVWEMCYTNKLGLAYLSHLAWIQMCALCACFAFLMLIALIASRFGVWVAAYISDYKNNTIFILENMVVLNA